MTDPERPSPPQNLLPFDPQTHHLGRLIRPRRILKPFPRRPNAELEIQRRHRRVRPDRQIDRSPEQLRARLIIHRPQRLFHQRIERGIGITHAVRRPEPPRRIVRPQQRAQPRRTLPGPRVDAIQNKAALLMKLSAIATPGAILTVFDYTQDDPIHNDPLKDLAGKPMYPIHINQFKGDLGEAGWEILEVTDMTEHYIRWYQNLLIKLSKESPLLKKEFSQQDLSKVKETFTLLLNQLEQGILGGAVIYARKQSD